MSPPRVLIFHPSTACPSSFFRPDNKLVSSLFDLPALSYPVWSFVAPIRCPLPVSLGIVNWVILFCPFLATSLPLPLGAAEPPPGSAAVAPYRPPLLCMTLNPFAAFFLACPLSCPNQSVYALLIDRVILFLTTQAHPAPAVR